MAENLRSGGGDTERSTAELSGEELNDAYEWATRDPDIFGQAMDYLYPGRYDIDEDSLSDEEKRKIIDIVDKIENDELGDDLGDDSGSGSPDTNSPDNYSPDNNSQNNSSPDNDSSYNGRDYGAGFEQRGENGPRDKRKLGARGVVVGLAIGTALSAATLGITFLATRGGDKADNIEESDDGHKDDDPYDGILNTDNHSDRFETNEDKESISERSTYHGRFASEDGKTYNPEKKSNIHFGPGMKEGMTLEEKKDRMIDMNTLQTAQLATTIYNVLQEVKEAANGGDLSDVDLQVLEKFTGVETVDEITAMLEQDKELHDKAGDFITDLLKYSDTEEEKLNGWYSSYYMDSKFETGDADTSVVEVVGSRSEKHNLSALKITTSVALKNGGGKLVFTMHYSEVCDQWQTEIELVYIKKVPEPDETTEEGKKSPTEKQMQEGATSKVTNLKEESKVADKPEETADYDRNTHTGKKEKTTETTPTEVKPSNEQHEKMDTKTTDVGDGTGRTIDEAQKQQDQKGGAGGEKVGNSTTVSDEEKKQMESDAAGQEAQDKADAGAADEAEKAEEIVEGGQVNAGRNASWLPK